MPKIRTKLTNFLEYTTITLLLLMIITVFSNVVMRYVFNNSYIALQELEWHFFSALFLLGMSYGFLKNSHVCVDVFHQYQSPKLKHIINIIGVLFLVLPMAFLLVYYGSDFAYQSFLLNEQSGDPGGLSHRFIIKSIIPLSFILLIITSLDFAYRAFLGLKNL